MNRAALVKTLELVSLALAANNNVPLLQCFQFTGKMVHATDGAVSISAPCETEEAFAVNGKLLLGLLSNTQVEEVEFTVSGQDVEVKAGKSRFKLPFLPESDFIFAVKADKAKPLGAVPINETIIDGLTACLMTASRDAAQAALMGVTLNRRGKQALFYSCDGDALTRFDTKAGCTVSDDILIPNIFIEAVIKISKAVGTDEKAKCQYADTWIKASLPSGFVVFGHVIENQNPLDHADVIKKVLKGTPTWVKLPQGLSDALARAEIVAKPESAKTTLTVEGGKLKLLTETHMGVVRDTVPLSGHPDVTANVSSELMQRTIPLCDELTITDRCVAYRSRDVILQIISNITK